MGRRRARYNEKARAASRPATALPHPKPRDNKKPAIGVDLESSKCVIASESVLLDVNLQLESDYKALDFVNKVC